MATARSVPAVATAIRVIEFLAGEGFRGVGAGEIARELGINRSTCYNVLATLEQHGWVVQSAERGARWTLGPGLMRLAQAPDDHFGALLQAQLHRLAGELRQVVFTARQRADGDYVVTDRAEGGGLVRITVEVGEAFPFAAPALMRVFHAWLPDAELTAALRDRPIEPFTPHTRVDPAAVAAELAATRARGYAVSLGEYHLSQSGVAAPIFDARGRVTAALCMLAFSSELDAPAADAAGAALSAAARRLTDATGGRAPDEGRAPRSSPA